MRFSSCVGVTVVAVALLAGGCGSARKPATEPMATDGPNQYVFVVPTMT